MEIIIKIGRFLLQIVYDCHKLAPTRNRITIISRQSDTASVDIEMLADEIRRELPDFEVTVLCRMIKGKASYLWHMITSQMHAVATSRVVVLDTYCIIISLLRHKRDLKVLQMWHAMGAYKKFGKSIIGQEEGSSAKMDELMHMHRGYDRLIASSERSTAGFGEAFGYGRESFTIMPLPRTDLLRSREYMEKKRSEIMAEHPELEGREVILYAPTFRRNRSGAEGSADAGDSGTALTESGKTELVRRISELAELADEKGYVCILSVHPIVSDEIKTDKAMVLKGYSTMELLSVADHFITDYSAMIYEAAAAGVRSYIYAYDLDDFVRRRGFYLDPYHDLPGDPKKNADEIMAAIESDTYDYDRLRSFEKEYVADIPECTKGLVGVIRDLMKA